MTSVSIPAELELEEAPPAHAADERFERFARTAVRLADVPYAFMSVDGVDGPQLKAVHGLTPREALHALAFADPQIVASQVFNLPDAHANPLFRHNPLVIGPAHVRSVLTVAVNRGPGFGGGALCVMHDEPRHFRSTHVLALQDLARLAETDLRLEALTAMHKRVSARVDQLEKRNQELRRRER